MGKRCAHLLKHERRIWSRYQNLYPCEWDELVFDVHVGGVRDDHHHLSDESLLYMWGRLVKKRIDVVARLSGDVYLFEIKHNATHHAIGQLLCYNILYRRDFAYNGKVNMMLITDFALPDIDYLCGVFGIHLVEV